MISVLLIGNGNVATHLANVFEKAKNIHCTQIHSRTMVAVPKADVTVISVSDDAIAEVSVKIKNTLVVHTSGSVPLNGLQNTTRKGVFYPLQTFSKDKEVNFSDIPFCVEATNDADLKLLKQLAKSIGKNVFEMSSEQRQSLHVAAVFVSNFTNHLYAIGEDICRKNKMPFSILKPLIRETAAKIELLSPKEAQTGPAVRNDETTIEKHLKVLELHQQEIYKNLTKSIQHGKEL